MWKTFLFPVSLVYGFITAVRNRLYDSEFLKSEGFDIPVISVGNITVGGTGKTPHIEYLIRLLLPKFRVAVLSRGYMRKTRGYRLVETTSSVVECGDEPLQIKRKFPGITMAVCENRVKGVRELLKAEAPPQVMLLDDAFQHRRIRPGIHIVLVEYNKPLKSDHMLPRGRLRENPFQLRRANIIIVTKCPDEVTPITRRIMARDLHLYPYQDIFFTSLIHGQLYPAFPDAPPLIPDEIAGMSILAVTGIASPEYMIRYLAEFGDEVENVSFPDHHYYTRGDIFQIKQRFHHLKNSRKIIVTTEKDLTRLTGEILPGEIKQVLYVLPVEVRFHDPAGTNFEKKISKYVGKN